MTDIEKQRTIEVEKGLDQLAFYLDDLFRIPGVGWRFGLDALIGLVPNVGDTLTSFASFYILLAGVRYGVPKITLLRMAFNIGLDYFVGSIPVIGDAFDFVWKANKQNMELIRTRAAGKGKGKKSDYVFVIALIVLLTTLLIGSIIISGFIIYWIVSSRPLI
ncbi:MAG: DUF4112 domain-containing protein [Acidobacteriota bacterium]